jgi:hypothetical protein
MSPSPRTAPHQRQQAGRMAATTMTMVAAVLLLVAAGVAEAWRVPGFGAGRSTGMYMYISV